MNKIIKNFKIHSSPGQDNIHNSLIKNTSTKIRVIILALINLTIKKNQLPSNWKNSIVTMIPKKCANSSDPKDYRPISLTSCLAKITEKLIAIRLKSFLKQNKIILQDSYLQDSCINRLDFLKVVSKRNYGLSLNTLNQLYMSLIRSILEYSTILFHIISQLAFNKLNIIQKKSNKNY